MLDTIALILIALSFEGIVERNGMVHSIVKKILAHAKRGVLFTNFAIGARYVALVLPGRMLR